MRKIGKRCKRRGGGYQFRKVVNYEFSVIETKLLEKNSAVSATLSESSCDQLLSLLGCTTPATNYRTIDHHLKDYTPSHREYTHTDVKDFTGV